MFFSEQKAAFNESFTGEDEMPFLCAMKDGQKGGSKGGGAGGGGGGRGE